MNNKINVTTLLFLLLVTAAGCLVACKKNSVNSPNPYGGGSISATIDGADWKATNVIGVDSSGLNGIYMVGVDNNANNGNSLSFVFPDTVRTGTWNMDNSQNILMELGIGSSSGTVNAYIADPSFGGSGSLAITMYDKSSKRVEGSFSGMAKNINGDGTSKMVTNGKFALNYR